MSTLFTATSAAALAQLQEGIPGGVLLPGDAGYNDARRAWNLSVDQHPAVIVTPRSAAEVAAALRFAREEGLSVAVQSTGHGVIRPADGSLLLLTSQLDQVRVDAAAQTARIEGGAMWGPVLEQAQAVGLAPLLGSSPNVGVVGYTLGGGMGWLARKYGLAADSVLAFEVVTADGQQVRASRTENPDLFWGLRGGGGSFGVITALEIQLYPVTTVFGGNLLFPAAQAKELLALYRDWIKSLPEEFTTGITLMNFPPLPLVPEFLRGQSVVILRGCFVGPADQGADYLRVWQERFTPIANTFHAMPFSEVASISQDPEQPIPSYGSGGWLRDLSDEAIDTLVHYGVTREGAVPILMTEIRHVDGALTRVGAEASAFSRREHGLVLNVRSFTPTPESHAAVYGAIHEFKRALGPALSDGVYMNFLEGSEVGERTADGFSPDAFRRLRALKAQYDPQNVFSHGYQIPPAEEA